VTEADQIADAKNKENFSKGLQKIDDEFQSRKVLIFAAIGTVLLGGIVEFIGGVFF
jgi:hypothetical protein